MSAANRIYRVFNRRLKPLPAEPSRPPSPLSELRIGHLVAVVVIIVCWLGARQLQANALSDRKAWPRTDAYLPVPPASTARFVSLGYNELAADVAWASTMVYYGSSRIGTSDFRYLERFIDTIIALDPYFYRIYEWASYAVTFRKSRATQQEFRTSIKYLEEGIKQFPNRYRMYWQLGLRYWIDLRPKDKAEKLRNRNRAAYSIERAIHCPDAPPGLATLAASMRTQLGQYERARHTLQQMILTTTDATARKKLETRFRDLVPPSKSKEIEAAQKRFQETWQATLPYAPPDLFVLIGPKPDPSIDFDRLATPRDLFGSSASDFDYLAKPDKSQ